MPEEKNYVTNGKLNTVIFEIKNEIKDIDNKHERFYTELRHSNQALNTTLTNLNTNIEKNTLVMTDMANDLKDTKDKMFVMEKENVARDYILKDLEEFKEETAGKLSSRFGEKVKIIGFIVTAFSGITIAIINVAPALFGGG